jgi:transcriptional regulator with XRE-family HTH domain
MPSVPALVPQSDLAVRLGAALRKRRKALAISATAAAEAAQISRVTWHRLEKGELTVALGSFLASAQVLGMAVDLQTEEEPRPQGDQPLDTWLPLQIRLGDYPQLRALAWQVGDGAERLAPHEVLGLYERNWRHVRPEALEPAERALIEALRVAFGAEALRV